jgi:arylsulfatase A-like enzyme
MTRRTFLGSAAMAPAFAQGQAARRPNILFMFSDDHAWQAVSAYGRGLNHTPNIDRIAREGVRFDNCLVTNSICSPSRAVILTGKYSHANGVLDNRQTFDGAQQTFPKLLRGAGYQTAMIGKWHLKSDPTGFDHWEVLPGQGNYYNPDFLYPGGRRRREGYVTELITDLALDWLKNGRDPSKPFLMMCQHKAPHRNWMPAPSKLHLYDGVTFPEPPTLFDNYEHRASPAHKQEMEIDRHMTLIADLKIVPPGGSDQPDYKRYLGEYARMNEQQKRMWDAAYGPRNDAFFRANPQGRDLVRWKYQRYMQDYLRSVASVDDSVGELTRYLDATGLAENTIVVYASDQGFFLGEHGWFDKRWIYEESLRTPCVMRWPGVTKAGTECKAMTSNVDFAETFLDAAGVAVPKDMQGRSFKPLLGGGPPPRDWRKSFYYHYYEQAEHNVARHRGVRTPEYTLAHFYDSDEWELYDLRKDPRQMRSIYADPAYARVVRELKDEMERLRRELNVPDKDPDRA